MHKKVQIIYEHNKPHGIRDSTGYLFFFTPIRKYNDQEERYKDEIMEQFRLAEYLVKSLEERK
jgi:hypothetical protein